MKDIQELLASRSGIRLDIGGGANPQPGFVNLDVRDLPTVDICWDARRMPWPLPDESVLCAVASHLVEHISPDAGDHRIELLVNLLVSKGLLSADEVNEHLGEVESKPRFIRFMDEVWRVLKPGGEFAISCPHAFSVGQSQDPTHVNPVNEITWAYFDPFESNTGGLLWRIYRPMPYRIKYIAFDPSANMEVVLVKRSLSEVANV